jgi:hypothetical protein
MKKILLFLPMLCGVLACSKDDSGSMSPRLKNCRIEYLFFRDDIRTWYYEPISFPASTDPLICSYFYSKDNVTRSTGGFVPVPSGGNLISYIFSEASYDSMICNTDRVVSYTKFVDDSGSTYENRSNPVIFYLNSEKNPWKISYNITVHHDSLKEFFFTYKYSEGQISEWTYDSIPYRTFYFENQNLVRVVSERHDTEGKLASRREILFTDYDDSPNPFKGLYYVRGAFFRAFSENNYWSWTINDYGWLADSTFGIYSYQKYSTFPIHTSDGYPAFGDYF